MTITVKIGSAGAGRDYATIQAAWNALPATLTDHYIFECYNDSEFTAGLDTSASAKTMAGFTVTIKPAAGQGFRDHANKLTNALRYNQANGVAFSENIGLAAVFNIKTNGIILDGLQIKNPSTNGFAVNDSLGATLTVGPVIKNCLMHASKDAGGALHAGYGKTLLNNIVIQTRNTGHGIYAAGGTGDGKVKGNTVVYVGSGTSSGRGVFAEWNAQTALDNAVFGFTTGFYASSGASYTPSSDYNATDLAATGTSTGTHNVVSLTATNQFQAGLTSEASVDLRVKAGAALIAAGVADADIPTDILGQTRGTPPGIGAAEYGAAASPPNAPTIGTTTAINNTGATINWTDNSADETGFKVEWSPSPYSVWTPASNSPAAANATSLAITGLTAATTYKARVASTNSGGDSAWVETATFTTTNTVRKLKLKLEAAAAGATNISGVVWAAQTGAIAGAEIGEFTGQTFEAVLEGGEAVLKVPVSAFGGGSLTLSDTPVALVRNATNTSGIVSCTVIDE